MSVFRRLALGVLAGSLAWGATASAQSVTGDFSVQRFDPAPGPRNFATVRGARVEGQMAWSAGVFFNYASKPFVLQSCASEDDCDTPNPLAPNDVEVVQSVMTFDALGSLTPLPWLQLGLKLPFTKVEGEGLARGDEAGIAAGNPDPSGLSTWGVGDVALEAKARLGPDPDAAVVPGVALFATGPLGTVTAKEQYVGDKTPTAGLRAILDIEGGPVLVGLNVAGVYRGVSEVGFTKVGSELRYGIVGGYAISKAIRAFVEGYGATDFRSKNPASPLEALLAAQASVGPLTFTAGGGTNVLKDIGVPEYRVFLGVLLAPGSSSSDKDGDGVPDERDACPKNKGDEDARKPGCPKNDKDDDLVSDEADQCPTTAEDPDDFDDLDGCPEKDNDQDGIPDETDKCPNKAENKNGFDDDDGCPDEHDRDRDGVPDTEDGCRREAEDRDGYKDEDGCPDPDNDKDGFKDEKDQCPDQPETENNFEDDDGCPDTR